MRRARVNTNISSLFIQNYKHIAANFRDKEIVSEAYLIATSKKEITPDNFVAIFGGIYRKQKQLHEIYAPLVIDINTIRTEPIDEPYEEEDSEEQPVVYITQRQLAKILRNADN